ncbi:hypothetical protein Tco_1077875 [Tanacetum coccineum]
MIKNIAKGFPNGYNHLEYAAEGRLDWLMIYGDCGKDIKEVVSYLGNCDWVITIRGRENRWEMATPFVKDEGGDFHKIGQESYSKMLE